MQALSRLPGLLCGTTHKTQSLPPQALLPTSVWYAATVAANSSDEPPLSGWKAKEQRRNAALTSTSSAPSSGSPRVRRLSTTVMACFDDSEKGVLHPPSENRGPVGMPWHLWLLKPPIASNSSQRRNRVGVWQLPRQGSASVPRPCWLPELSSRHHEFSISVSTQSSNSGSDSAAVSSATATDSAATVLGSPSGRSASFSAAPPPPTTRWWPPCCCSSGRSPPSTALTDEGGSSRAVCSKNAFSTT
mmetsp:Transcript_73938/g.158454  ORF Transcript_73938/g.158454 Transcript_73938/m.158454 type:complete len:246 (+) Transcript_73938:44-781(+)